MGMMVARDQNSDFLLWKPNVKMFTYIGNLRTQSKKVVDLHLRRSLSLGLSQLVQNTILVLLWEV